MNKKLTPILIAIGILILLGLGYFLVQSIFLNKNSENDTTSQEQETEDIEENNEGEFEYNMGDTNITIDTEEKTWPSDIPSNIPEFKYGDIDTVNTVTGGEYVKTWSVIYSNTSENSFNRYKDDLEKVGFETVSLLQTEQGSVTTVNKDPVTMVVTYIEGEKKISINITQTLE